MPQIAEDRPPYVSFELRAVEDRTNSIEAGHYVSKDVPFVLITPAGSKDRIEREAEDWFQYLQSQVQAERFPSEWYRAYKHAYEEWTKGNEPVLDGTDIKNWPVASPAQVKMLLAWNVRTVEDLARANEETLRRLGMGGHALKEKAIEWLSSAGSQGKVVEQIAALRAELADLKSENKELRQRVAEAEAKATPAKVKSTQ